MFLRKLHNVPDKFKWLLLELLVVFIGVYLAFLFSSYTQDRQNAKERIKVLTSLKKETERLRLDFPGNANYQRTKNQEWDSLYQIGEVANYYSWRYLEPQYNFKVIEYAINLQGTDIIDFALYEKLLNMYSFIKRLEHAERIMTEMGQKYNLIPEDLNPKSELVALKKQENRFHFWKFKDAAHDRQGNLVEVSKRSTELVKMINERLGPEKTVEVDKELLQLYYDAVPDTNFIKRRFREFFPQYSDEFFSDEFKKLTQQ